VPGAVPTRATRAGTWCAAVLLLALSACSGDSPVQPGPQPQPQPPPVNQAPVIESIAVQGTRERQPANFADLSETVNVTATVRDEETPLDQLQYLWTATSGTFQGAGRRVQWQAPSEATTPSRVTVTLEVTERYGQSLQHRVTRTAEIALHNSQKEVGDMARQFLLDFSNTDIKDASIVMRNFGTAATCPQPGEIASEREDVIRHYTNFRMISFRIGTPVVTINFGGSCPFRGKQGDACALVPVFWDSVDLRSNSRGAVEGTDVIAAAYSKSDARWWLCASDFDGRRVSGAGQSFYLR
jgi:hypothetical protein